MLIVLFGGYNVTRVCVCVCVCVYVCFVRLSRGSVTCALRIVGRC